MGNTYLNFLEEYRANNQELTAVESAKAARATWNALSSKEKLVYHTESNETIQDAMGMECGTCPKKKKRGCPKKKKKTCPKKKKRRCPKKKKPRCKPKNPCKKKKKRRQICC